jgi:putative Mg2+ transporter-C (MgtC) family protein
MSAAVYTAFGEPIGQGWEHVGYLAIALVLSLAIGTEREIQQKSAGIRTYTLVGLGSALFVLVSKYGFTDVLGEHVTLDPSRVAAQIVTGVGFIGGGLIFVRRDAVRGLTTAASVWVTAAIGSAAGGGLVVLAAVVTGMYFAVLYGVRPLARAVQRVTPDSFGLRIRYVDGSGVLRRVVNHVTARGFVVAELSTVQAGGTPTDDDAERDDRRDRDLPDTAAPPSIEVTLVLTGRGSAAQLTAELSEMTGVLSVRTGASGLED